MREQKFSPGRDEKRIQEVLAHYESQTENEEFAEIEAVLGDERITMMAMPNDLVPQVRAPIAQSDKS